MRTYVRDSRHKTFHLFHSGPSYPMPDPVDYLINLEIVLNIFKDLILLLYISYCTVEAPSGRALSNARTLDQSLEPIHTGAR